MALFWLGKGGEASAGSGNITLNDPAADTPFVVAANDVYFACIHSSDNVAHSMSGDWTQLFQANGGGTTSRLSVWYHRHNGSSNPSFTVTHTAGQTIIGTITCYRGVRTTGSPANVVGSGGAGTDASIEHTAISPTVDNCYILAINGSADDNARSTPPSTYTVLLEDTAANVQNCYISTAGNPDGSLAIHHLLQGTKADTGTVVDTQAAADAWTSVLIAIEPAATGPVVNTITPTDNLHVRDEAYRTLFKQISERQIISDASTVSRLVALLLAEAQSPITDTSSRLLEKLLTEAQSPVNDTASWLLQKLILETQSPFSEEPYRVLLKAISEQIEVTDSATAVKAALVLMLLLSDTVLLSDGAPGSSPPAASEPYRFVTKELRALVLNPESPFTIIAPPSGQEPLTEEEQEAVPETSTVYLQIIRQFLAQDQSPQADTLARLLIKVLSDREEISDSIVLTTSAAVLVMLTLSDDVAVRDTASRLLIKVLNDRTELYDAVSRLLLKLLGDSEEISDQGYRTLFKLLNESQEARDTIARVWQKQLSERQDISDTAIATRIAAAVLVELTLSDDLHVSDTASRLLHKLLTETQSISDAAQIARFVCLTLIDSVLVDDSGTRLLIKTLSDRQTLTENALLSTFRFVLASDHEDISDNTLRYITRFLLAQDTQYPLSDATSSVLLKIASDRLSLSDTALLASLRTLLASDREEVSDSASVARVRFLLAQDLQSPISDTVARLWIKILGDRVDISDTVQNTVAGILIILLTLSDSVLVSDAVTRDLYKLLTERQEISDTALLQRIRLLLAQDTEPVSDEAKFSRLLVLALLDEMAASDSSSNVLLKMLGDRQDVSDSTARTLLRFILATDREEISDSASVDLLGRILTLLITDNLAVQDAIAKTLLKHIGEAQFTADSFIKELAKSLTERQDVTDNTLFSRTIFRLAQDSQSLTDTSAQFLVRLIILALVDNLAVDDRTSKILFKHIGDQTVLSDDVARSLVRFLLTGDQVNPSDSATMQLTRFLGASDTQFVADVVSRVTAKLITDQALARDDAVRELRKILLDQVDLTDSATVDQVIQNLIRLFLSDNVAVADIATRELLKVIADEAAVRDELDMQMAQGVRRFIEFMLTREGSPLGMTGGSAPVQGLHASRERPAKSTSGMQTGEEGNYRLVTRIVDPQKKGPGTKGVRR